MTTIEWVNELNETAQANYRANLPAQLPDGFDYKDSAVKACLQAATRAGFDGVLEVGHAMALANESGDMISLWVDCPTNANRFKFDGIGFDANLEWYEYVVEGIVEAERHRADTRMERLLEQVVSAERERAAALLERLSK